MRYPALPVIAVAVVLSLLVAAPAPPQALVAPDSFGAEPTWSSDQRATASSAYVVISWNDLGMHCMNETYADLAVLPPYNTLWAQVVRKGTIPATVTNGVFVRYSIQDNTYSVGKTDFWTYAKALFGVDLAPNVGLTGATLSGRMKRAADHFVIEGVPLTPYRDSAPTPGQQNWYPYQMAQLVAKDKVSGKVLARTTPVAPVSTEMHCDNCHYDGAIDGIATGKVETNILTLHDRDQGTRLMTSRPVLCAGCHADNALGAPGQPGLPNLSLAMHGWHADVLMGSGPPPAGAGASDGDGPGSSATSEMERTCYQCHPGLITQCLRDTMFSEGLTCLDCHGTMADVADPARRPWIDLPRCGSCHEAQFAENPGLRYRDSVGHGGMYCEACHGSPHAILPTIQANDNLQSIRLQGHPGTLRDCHVCHGATVPGGLGPHGLRLGIQAPLVAGTP